MKNKTLIFSVWPALALLFSPLNAAANAGSSLIYLTCKADPEYKEYGPSLLIDRSQKTMRVMPMKETMPLHENAQEFVGRIEAAATDVIEISVNRYTLRYRSTNPLAVAFGMAPTVHGQCTVEQKKI